MEFYPVTFDGLTRTVLQGLTADHADGLVRSMVSSNAESPRIRTVIALTVLLPLALGAGWLVLDSVRIAATMPVQLNYVDGYTVDDALRLARGEPLYPDPTSAPYTVTVYTPVFLAATAALVRQPDEAAGEAPEALLRGQRPAARSVAHR